jgi:hypothetical protein
LQALAEKAGLEGVIVESRFPCRMLLSWRAVTQSREDAQKNLHE